MTKKRISLCTLILLLVVALMPQRSMGQVFETRTGVDTLTLAERISLHTNVVDWALLVPNIGVEFDIKNTNWNRHAVGVSFKTRWQTNSTYKQRYFYTITEGRVYWRNYWRSRQIDPHNDINPHTNFIDRLFSQRRTRVKHPKTTYYRGFYVSASDYSFRFGKEGRQGKAVSAGITYGCLRPLYQFKSGNSLDLEMGIDVGFMATKTEKFGLDENTNCYTRVTPSETKIVPFPLPTEARLAFVYRLGKYPITKKYRWRTDVDAVYADELREKIAEQQKQRIDNENAAKSRKEIEKSFWLEYDSIAAVNVVNNKARAAELEKQRAEAAKLAAEQQRLAKENARKEREEKKSQKAVADTAAIAVDTTMVENPVSDAETLKTDSVAVDETQPTSTENVSEAEEQTEKASSDASTEASEQTIASDQTPTSDNKEEKEESDEN